MSTWDSAKKRSEEAGSGMFLRLADDGQKFVGAFVGDPHVRELFWDKAADKYVDFTAEHEKAGKKPTPKYSINVYTPADGAVSIFDMNNATFKLVLECKEKYTLEKWFFEVKRKGKKGDTKTTYSVLPETQIDEKHLAAIKAATLHDLAKHRDDGDSASTDMNSHDKKAAPPPAEPETISKEEAVQIIDKLKVRPKEEIYAFLKKFGVAQVVKLRKVDFAGALAYLAPPAAAAQPAASADPFGMT